MVIAIGVVTLMNRIKDKFNFYFGFALSISHLMAWFTYSRTGCISMPYVHKLCGDEASGGLYASVLTFIIALYLIFVGVGFTNSTDKDKK